MDEYDKSIFIKRISTCFFCAIFCNLSFIVIKQNLPIFIDMCYNKIKKSKIFGGIIMITNIHISRIIEKMNHDRACNDRWDDDYNDERYHDEYHDRYSDRYSDYDDNRYHDAN